MKANGKNEFVGVRTTEEQRSKLFGLSILAGKPGNMSAGLRWWLDKAPSATVDVTFKSSEHNVEGTMSHE